MCGSLPQPMKKKTLDFRRDHRTSGIPRNYFLCNGKVTNISDALNERRSASSSKVQTSISSTTSPLVTKERERIIKNDSEKTLKLCDSPDRAGALLFVQQTNHPSPPLPLHLPPSSSITQSKTMKRKSPILNSQLKEYEKFILEGPRCTDGSYVMTLESQANNRRQLLFPCQSKDKLVCNLQR